MYQFVVCWNKGRLCWKIAKLFYFCHLKKLVRPETFGPYYVQMDLASVMIWKETTRCVNFSWVSYSRCHCVFTISEIIIPGYVPIGSCLRGAGMGGGGQPLNSGLSKKKYTRNNIPSVISLLKLRGYFIIYHQVEHSEILRFAHTYVWSVFTTESESVYCALRTEYLNTIYIYRRLYRIKFTSLPSRLHFMWITDMKCLSL